MEELFRKFLSGAVDSVVQAGVASLVSDVDFKDALNVTAGTNALSSVLGGGSPLDLFKNKQGTGPLAGTGPGTGGGPSALLNAPVNPLGLSQVQLAQRASSAPGQVTSALNDNINRGMAEIRVGFEKEFDFLTASGLQKYLAGLTKDEVVLTYHISPKTAQVWVAHKGRVERRSIAAPGAVYKDLQALRQVVAQSGNRQKQPDQR